jgi:hypothetical protein
LLFLARTHKYHDHFKKFNLLEKVDKLIDVKPTISKSGFVHRFDDAAADTTIFEKDGVWWLFSNIDPIQSGDHCSELSIFYSDDPLSDRWIPHPKNPVICNSLNARMGGILFDESGIYRVSQKQGIAQYGKASNINKIIDLSKTDYIEELIYTIEPNFFNNLKGTHHLHSNGEVMVFDFVKKSKLN